jgi:CO/xanthine dehydrogenase FAD-binding subunit
MLAADFDYYLPDTLKEATDIYASLHREGKRPYYYGGGTEIISMARVHNLKPDAVIDIKKIPECRGIGTDGKKLVFGAAVTLSVIFESGLFPLLGLAGGRIADHTIQDTIIYHETLLPLLLTDSMMYIASPGGNREVPISDVLARDRGLRAGELIVNVSFDSKYAACPYAHIKKSKTEKIGYPLVSLCALLCGGMMRTAASGVCSYPFRFCDLVLSDRSSTAGLADQLIRQIPAPVLDDLSGSAEYRMFVLKKTLENIIQKFKAKQKGSVTC